MVRKTKQKNLVSEALHHLHHPTAEEIYTYIKGIYPSISIGTVYRILGSFEQKNEILHIKIANKPDHYDFRTHPHYHFYCKTCEKVYDINIPNIPKFDQEIDGHLIEEHLILFNGICANCNHKEGN